MNQFIYFEAVLWIDCVTNRWFPRLYSKSHVLFVICIYFGKLMSNKISISLDVPVV